MARLPIPGQDSGTWGTVLNEFLQVGHNADGTTKGVINAYNIRDYGAIGDGVADDTAAIQAAIDAASINGGEIALPAGVYRITAALSLPSVVQRSVTMRGAGMSHPSSPDVGGTVIKVGAACNAINIVGTTGNQNDMPFHVGIRDLTIYGALGTHATGHGLSVRNAVVHVDRILIQNCAEDGLNGTWAVNSVFSHCSFNENGRYGVRFIGETNAGGNFSPDQMRFWACVCNHNGGGGILLTFGTSTIIRDCTISINHGFQVRLEGCACTLITGCQMEDPLHDTINSLIQVTRTPADYFFPNEPAGQINLVNNVIGVARSGTYVVSAEFCNGLNMIGNGFWDTSGTTTALLHCQSSVYDLALIGNTYYAPHLAPAFNAITAIRVLTMEGGALGGRLYPNYNLDNQVMIDCSEPGKLVQEAPSYVISSVNGVEKLILAIGMPPKFDATTILEFADNAAALAGGLSIGHLYRTGDILKIVH